MRAERAAGRALAITLIVLGSALAILAAVGFSASTAGAQEPSRLPPPQVSPDQARQDARDILSRPEYQEPPKTWADEVKEWIGERLADLFQGVSGGSGGPIMWIVLAGIVGALLYFLLRIRGNLGLRGRESDDPLFVTELEASRSPVEWLTEAERLEAKGEWKQALRCRYRALIGHLIDEGVVRDIPGRTSGEFRAETRRRAPELAPAFASASELFDDAWYGDRKTGPDESRQFQAAAQDILRRASRHKADQADTDRNEPLRVTVGDR